MEEQTQRTTHMAISQQRIEPSVSVRPSRLKRGNRLVDESAQRKAAYLSAYPTCGTARAAAEAVGISPDTVRQWKRRDPDFAKAADNARAEFAEYLEDIAIQRIRNPERSIGSDLLLIALLNANAPDKYRPHSIPQSDSAKELIYEMRRAARRDAETEVLPGNT